MLNQPLRLRIFLFMASVVFLAFSGGAGADPPSRVARLGYLSGSVNFSPAGENDWDQASINRPMTTGDRLWAEPRARAEMQVGGAMIRLNADTGISILNLDDRITQLQLTQGVLHVRVRHLEDDQVFEVDTPNLAFTLRSSGEFRIEVDPDGNATTIFMRNGRGEAYGEDASYLIDARQAYRFTGTRLREVRYIDTPRLDEFDRWSSDRDRGYDNSISARYVSRDMIGYQDLDANGSWLDDATYGNVWFPNRVAADWAPYRDGHWAWIDPWGWTWVDDEPWGFAVSHYGRWTNLRGRWGWVPGPTRTRAYYAPALVVFVGGDNFQLTLSGGNVGGIAWFPLGPREVYRPSYPVSRGYFENINRSNTVINNTVINNTYNNSNVTNIVYANRQVQGAVIAVPTNTFVQSQPVSKAAVRVPREMVDSRPVEVAPPVAPTERSVRGASTQGGKPPPHAFERPVVARTAPPPAKAGFAEQRQQLKARPGKPLDDDARQALKPAPSAPAPIVKVVAPARIAPPTAPPPPAKDSGKTEKKSDNGREKPNAREAPTPPPSAKTPPPPEAKGKEDPRQRPATAPVERAARPKPTPVQQNAPGSAQPEKAQPKAQPTPTGRQTESRQPGAKPDSAPGQSGQKAESRGNKPGAAADQTNDKKRDKKKDGDPEDREEGKPK